MAKRSVEAAMSRVLDRVSAAARRAGRDPSDVRVVAVSKGVSPDRIAKAVGAGVQDIGENRAQELHAKAEALGDVGVRWHFVGPLQTNKVRYLDKASVLHSVDRLREAAALQAHADRSDRLWDALIEVNIGRERSKEGIAPTELGRLLDGLGAYPLVRPRGLMFVAPQVQNAEDVRAMFAEARGLRERFAGYGLDELSMGMTDDFEVAIEEGATIVRIGRAIFSPEDG
jgi:hypothetical protein